MRHWLLLILVAGASACAQPLPVPVSPSLAHTVYSDPGRKVPGQWGAFVQSGSFSKEAHGRNRTFSIDANAAFVKSVKSTLVALFEQIEFLSSKPSAKTIIERGFDGFIIVQSDDFTPTIISERGFFDLPGLAAVEMSSVVTIETHKERLLGFTANGDGSAKGVGGASGAGFVDELSEATSNAMQELMDDIAKKISFSQRLREETTAPRLLLLPATG